MRSLLIRRTKGGTCESNNLAFCFLQAVRAVASAAFLNRFIAKTPGGDFEARLPVRFAASRVGLGSLR